MADPRISTIQSIYNKLATMDPDKALRSTADELYKAGTPDDIEEAIDLGEALRAEPADKIMGRIDAKMKSGRVRRDVEKPGLTPATPEQMGEREKGVMAQTLVETAKDPLAQTMALSLLGGGIAQGVTKIPTIARGIAGAARQVGPGAIRTAIRAIPEVAPLVGQTAGAMTGEALRGTEPEGIAKTGAAVAGFGALDTLLMKAVDRIIPGASTLAPAMKQTILQNPNIRKVAARAAVGMAENTGLNAALGVDNATLENMLMTGSQGILSGVGGLPPEGAGSPRREIMPLSQFIEQGPQAVTEAKTAAQSFLTGDQIRYAAEAEYLARQGMLDTALRKDVFYPGEALPEPTQPMTMADERAAAGLQPFPPLDVQAPETYQTAERIQTAAREQLRQIKQQRAQEAEAISAENAVRQAEAEARLREQTAGRVGEIRGEMAPQQPVLPVTAMERATEMIGRLPAAPEVPTVPKVGVETPKALGGIAYEAVNRAKEETFAKGRTAYEGLMDDAAAFDIEAKRENPAVFADTNAALQADLKDIRTKYDAVANSAQGQFGVSPTLAMEIVGIIDQYLARGQSLGLSDMIQLKRDLHSRAGNVLFNPNRVQKDARAAAPAYQLRNAIDRAMEGITQAQPNLPELGAMGQDILARKADADKVYAAGYHLENKIGKIIGRQGREFDIGPAGPVTVVSSPAKLGRTLLSADPDAMEKVARLNTAVQNAVSTAKLSPEIVPNLENMIVQTRGNMELNEINKIMAGKKEATPELAAALEARKSPGNPMNEVIDGLTEKIRKSLESASAQTALRVRQDPEIIQRTLFTVEDPTGAKSRDYEAVVGPAVRSMPENERHSLLDAALQKVLGKSLPDGRVDPANIAKAKAQPFYADLPEPLRKGIDALEAMGPSTVSAIPARPTAPSERMEKWEEVLNQFSKLPKGMKSVTDILADNLLLGTGDVNALTVKMAKRAAGEKGWQDIRQGVVERLLRSDTDFLPDNETRVIHSDEVLRRMESMPQAVRSDIFGAKSEEIMARLRREIPIQRGLEVVMGAPQEQASVGGRRIIAAQSGISATTKNLIYSLGGFAGGAGAIGTTAGLAAGLATLFVAGYVYPKYVASKILGTPGLFESFILAMKKIDDTVGVSKAPGAMRGVGFREKQMEQEVNTP